MRVLISCMLAGWLALFGVVGCKKTAGEGVASARSTLNGGLADRFNRTAPPKTRAMKPMLPAKLPKQPSYLTRKAQPLPKKIQQVLAGIGQTLQRVQSVYAKAFVKGKLKHWRAYYKADSLLGASKRKFASVEAQVMKLDPVVGKQMKRSLSQLAKLIREKASPQRTGHFAYAVLQAAYHADPNQKNALLNDYRAAIKQVEQNILAEKVSGIYRAGLMLMPVQPIMKLTEVGKKDIRTRIVPPKGTAHTIGVFLRHAKTGVPLAGTDVSVEIINAKTRRQLSTQLLHLMWDGAPKYVGHLRLPRKDQVVIVQVTVSPFPLSRTQYSRNMLRKRSTIQFAGLVKSGQLSFSKRKPVHHLASGHDLMRAISLVGGQTNVTGPYRVGMALVPLQTLYSWDNGNLKQMWRSRRASCQLVVFIQDKRTGLLVPGGRIEAFIYWRNKKGDLYRTREVLKPVFDGFHSYRIHLTVRPGTFDMRLRLDPPLVSRFSSSLPATRTVHFKDIKHPSLLKRFYRKPAARR